MRIIDHMLTDLLAVFASGMIGLWEGIPVGFALRLPALVVGAVSTLGSTTATVIVLLLGEAVRARLARRRVQDGRVARERWIDRAWKSYGVMGFALLAPGLIGAPLGVATGLVLGAPARRLVPLLIVGISIWTVILTVAGAYGNAGIRALIAP
jgi:membrane protein YqaA with SNARE-associated domain